MKQIDPLKVGLPANLDCERFILGSVLLNDAKMPLCASQIEPQDFSLEKHRRIWARMVDLHERSEAIDRVTVANELRAQGQLEADGLTYLVSLDDGLPEVASLDSYIRIVKEKSTRRRLILSAQAIINRCLSPAEESGEIASALESEAAALSRRSITAVPDTNLGSVIERIGVSSILDPPIGLVAPPWKQLEADMSGGARPGEMWIVAARPSVGKSTAIVQWAVHAATLGGQGGTVFSLEMKAASLLKRIIAAKGDVPHPMLLRGDASRAWRARIRETIGEIADWPLSIRDDCRSLKQIIAAMAQSPWPLVIVDYLGLVEPGKVRENRNQEVSYISRKLKLAALDYGKVLICAHQLNRANETENRPPQLSDMRDSGSLEQDADGVILLDAPFYRGKSDTPKDQVDMILAKQRDGIRGNKFTLKSEGQFCRLVDPRDAVEDNSQQKTFFS